MPVGAKENKAKQWAQKQRDRNHHTPPGLCTDERSLRIGQAPWCKAVPGYKSLASKCWGRHFRLCSRYCFL